MAQNTIVGRRLSPRLWGLMGAGLGITSFAAILWTADPEAAFGESLGNALTAFLGFVVAGWGIAQADIAGQARDAAEQQAFAAREQVEEARLARQQAEARAANATADAIHQRDHADRTLRATIKQRLDAQAPRVVIRRGELPINAPAFEWRDAGVSYMNAAGRPATDWQQDKPTDPFRLTGSGGPNIEVRVRVAVHMRLVGNTPARIDIVEGTPDDRYQRTVILTDERPEWSAVWTYTSSANALHTEAHNSDWNRNAKLVRPKFWVRDLTMNTLDPFELIWNFQLIRRDGDFLTLTPEAVNLGDEFAGQMPRRYEYFERPEGLEEVGGVTQLEQG